MAASTVGRPHRHDYLWAVADQVAISGGRFLVGWTLARLATKEEYGGFVLAYAVLLTVEILQAGLVTWPMAVLGPRQGGEFPAYVAGALRLQVGLGAALGLVVLLSAGGSGCDRSFGRTGSSGGGFAEAAWARAS